MKDGNVYTRDLAEFRNSKKSLYDSNVSAYIEENHLDKQLNRSYVIIGLGIVCIALSILSSHIWFIFLGAFVTAAGCFALGCCNNKIKRCYSIYEDVSSINKAILDGNRLELFRGDEYEIVIELNKIRRIHYTEMSDSFCIWMKIPAIVPDHGSTTVFVIRGFGSEFFKEFEQRTANLGIFVDYSII